MHIPELLSPEDLMARLKVTRRWIEKRVALGELHPIKLGRLNRFTEADVAEYLARNNGGQAVADDDSWLEGA